MKYLLRLKSWQLFVLIIGPALIPDNSLWIRLIYILGLLIYIAWIYSIGVLMNLLFFGENKPSLIYFKICCVITSLIYIAQSFIRYDYSTSVTLLVILCLLCIMFYMFMFAARMIESVANGYLVNRSDSLKAFFGFWFFPIGIWFIQPAVQRLLKQNEVRPTQRSTVTD